MTDKTPKLDDAVFGIPKAKSAADDLDSKAFRLGFQTALLQSEREQLEKEKAQASAEISQAMAQIQMMALQAQQQAAQPPPLEYPSMDQGMGSPYGMGPGAPPPQASAAPMPPDMAMAEQPAPQGAPVSPMGAMM